MPEDELGSGSPHSRQYRRAVPSTPTGQIIQPYPPHGQGSKTPTQWTLAPIEIDRCQNAARRASSRRMICTTRPRPRATLYGRRASKWVSRKPRSDAGSWSNRATVTSPAPASNSANLSAKPAIGGRHLVIEADWFRPLGPEEGHQEQAPWCQDTHLLGEQRGQFSRWGMDHRVVGQHSAERAVLDRQGFHSRFVEPQCRMGPPSVVDHGRGEVEPEGVQPQVVQHGRQMTGSAPDVGCPPVPRATHELGEGADHVPRERLCLQPISEHRRVQLDDPVVGRPGLVLVF